MASLRCRRPAAVFVAVGVMLGASACAEAGPAHRTTRSTAAGSTAVAPPDVSRPPANTTTGDPARGPGPRTTYRVQRQPAPGACHYRTSQNGQPLQDPACTPGAVSPTVTQDTLESTICRRGYTRGVRPPVSVTAPEKRANARAYGYTGSLHDAEYDHLISLELGGDPDDARNLWVEPPSPGHRPGSGPNNPKDTVESRLHAAVCGHRVSLAAAQQAIVADWSTALATLHLT